MMAMALPVRLIVLFVLVVLLTKADCKEQKVQVTRTALHVARSLDPDAMEEMQVKTRTGEVATLLVKKRDGRHSLPFTVEEEMQKDNKTDRPSSSNTANVPKPVIVSSLPINTEDEIKDTLDANVDETDKIVEKNVNEAEKKDDSASSKGTKTNRHLVPEPVYVRSSTVLVKGQQSDPWNNRARSLMTIDSEGIPVIEGVRMPDDESDKVVWRNARVIDGKLTPYEKTQSKHNFDIKPSPEKKKTALRPVVQWTKLEPVKPIAQKEPLASYKNPWNSAPVAPPPAPEKFKPSELIAVVTTPSDQEWHEYHHPQPVVQIADKPTSVLPEGDQYIRDRILDYIKRINAEELKKQYANRESRTLKDFEPQPQIQARVLHNPGASVYPTSLLYSPPSQQPSRVSFEEGVRTPVLQYAHPELGVQPAKVVSNPESEDSESPKPTDRREQALAYFAHDIHADRSPYAFEPGLEDEARVEDFDNNGKRSHSGVSQRPKKTLPYFYSDQAVTDSYKDKYYSKYSYNPSGYPSYGTYPSAMDTRPFWQRMSDTIKEHVQTSMDKVSDLARPVMDPLVEASHKISKNLGLETSGYRELNTIKEKLGMAGSPSVLLPALGLVAGGAALGLGAVAVGRYLDVDMLKRSKDSDLPLDGGLSAEHKRALESIARSLAEEPQTSLVSEPASPEEAKEAMDVVRAVEAAEAENKDKKEKSLNRRRRSVEPEEAMDAMLQSLDPQKPFEGTVPSHAVWSTTPCAKKVFCEVMSSQSDDSVLLTEKKMATYLNMIHPSMAHTVGFHLDDVMSAVRAKDCSPFYCPSVTPKDLSHFPAPR